MIKKPWEKRLKDLFFIFQNCAKTYFEPDIFRMNLNHFLQTSRTVTFIIQKNKKDIPNFDLWYENNILCDLKGDQLMEWAKDSRNTIEKKGDLEMYSTANATLFFSYIEEEDISLTDCPEILHISVKRLIRLAQKKIPTGILDSSAVQIERRWVANSLPDWELLHALATVYIKLYKSCKKLALYLESPMTNDIPSPSRVEHLRNKGRNIQYVKIKNLQMYSMEYITESKLLNEEITESVKTIFTGLKEVEEPRSIKGVVEYYSELAVRVFNEYGYHLPILFLLDEDSYVMDMIGVNLDDQVDKYIFWRAIAERSKSLNVSGLVWISEAWVRSTEGMYIKALKNLEIVGENLVVEGVDYKGEAYKVYWNIVRETPSSIGKLGERKYTSMVSNYMIPFLKSKSIV